jgi:hypothetical protein
MAEGVAISGNSWLSGQDTINKGGIVRAAMLGCMEDSETREQMK